MHSKLPRSDSCRPQKQDDRTSRPNNSKTRLDRNGPGVRTQVVEELEEAGVVGGKDGEPEAGAGQAVLEPAHAQSRGDEEQVGLARQHASERCGAAAAGRRVCARLRLRLRLRLQRGLRLARGGQAPSLEAPQKAPQQATTAATVAGQERRQRQSHRWQLLQAPAMCLLLQQRSMEG
jgi:hypothetical protein